MNYISVKNLDKYQPHYRDGRNNLWIRWDIKAIKDYKVFKLTPQQRWLFIGLICLACENENQIPYDIEWLCDSLKYPKSCISKDLNMLQTLELVVTNCNEPLQIGTYIQTIQTIQTDNTNIVDFFNYFLLKTKKQFKLTPTCRALIHQRLNDGFTIDQLKQAVDNFITDDWPDRAKHLDLIYCIGKQQGKPDNLDKWLNYKPKENKWPEYKSQKKEEVKNDLG